MDFLYIPIIGAGCLVVVVLLLLMSLWFHFRNADSVRIRFLKHSYRSIWIEAPGFCEVQHRNYVYSYSQSHDMVTTAAPISEYRAWGRNSNSSIEEPSTGRAPLVRFQLTGGRRLPVFSLEDEADIASALLKSTGEDDIGIVPPPPASAFSRHRSGGKLVQMMSQQSEAEAEIMASLAEEDAFASLFDDDIAAASSSNISQADATITPSSSTLNLSSQGNPPEKRIHKVLKDFYSAVRAMELQDAEPSDERLQQLASTYGEQLRDLVQKKVRPSKSFSSPNWELPAAETPGFGLKNVTVGQATGLRRFWFSGRNRQGAKSERMTRLAPRLSSSQSSV